MLLVVPYLSRNIQRYASEMEPGVDCLTRDRTRSWSLWPRRSVPTRWAQKIRSESQSVNSVRREARRL